MVDVWGSGLSPAPSAWLTLDSNRMASTNVAGVRVLFNKVPAPLVVVSANQRSAAVPYFGAIGATTNAQVEHQGVRSNPFPLTVSPTAPGFFTANASGSGQGSILNLDNSVNSAANPAARGSVVTLWHRRRSDRPSRRRWAARNQRSTGANSSGYSERRRLSQPGSAVPMPISIGRVSSQDAVTVAGH